MVENVYVGLCMPNMGVIVDETVSSMLRLFQYFDRYRIGDCKSQKLQPFIGKSSLLSQTRQILFKSAVEAGCTHILAVDSDIKFPKQVVHGMIKHDVDFVAANYVTKKIPAEPVSVGLDYNRKYTDDDSTGLEEIMHTGLGLALIKTEILKDLPFPWFTIDWKEESESYMGEDVFFCHLLREQGVKIHVDHDLSKLVEHVGAFAFNHDYCGSEII